MKKALLILLLASPCLAEGPRYKHKDRAANLEFQNVYQDLRSVRVTSTTLPSGSTHYIQNTTNPTTSTQVFNVSKSYVGNGSSTAPSYSFSGSTTTGIYTYESGGSYGWAVTANGLDRFFVAPSGAFYILSAGVTTIFNASENGEITQPLQPSFMANNSVEDVDVTGDSTVFNVDFDTERFDLGGDFANDTFTAPVDGKYQFNVVVLFNEILVSHTNTYIELATSNESYFSYEDSVGAKTYAPFILSVVVDMDSGDTATVNARAAGSTKTVDIYGDGTSSYTYFSGSLIN